MYMLRCFSIFSIQLLGDKPAQPLRIISCAEMTEQQCYFVGCAFVFQIALEQRFYGAMVFQSIRVCFR